MNYWQSPMTSPEACPYCESENVETHYIEDVMWCLNCQRSFSEDDDPLAESVSEIHKRELDIFNKQERW